MIVDCDRSGRCDDDHAICDGCYQLGRCNSDRVAALRKHMMCTGNYDTNSGQCAVCMFGGECEEYSWQEDIDAEGNEE